MAEGIEKDAEVIEGLTKYAGKHLTFSLRPEEYGIEITRVQEIIGIMEITLVPKTPKFVKGVINLRGKVIPIIDLRQKFGMSEVEVTEETCIIVVETKLNDSMVLMGVIVDAVNEVLDITAESIEAAPQFGGTVNVEYIRGIAKRDTRVSILLDIDMVLTNESLVLEKLAK